MQKEANLLDMLRRPEVTIDKLLALFAERRRHRRGRCRAGRNPGQIRRLYRQAGSGNRKNPQRYDHLRLPETMDYSKVSGLSNEVSQKLAAQRPETLGQASRIPGMTPAAISLLLIYMKKKSA